MKDSFTNKTLTEINDIVGRINTHPEYSHTIGDSFVKFLREEADRHSVSIEINGEVNNHKLRDKMRINSLKNLDGARKFLNINGLNLGTLASLGKIIEPERHPLGTFRNCDVDFGGFHAPPLNTVYERMDSLVYLLQKDVSNHPVVRASAAHLGIVENHPYIDGNGRAARLIQNYILESNKLPPAVIDYSEASLYKGIIGLALKDRYNNESDFFHPSNAEKIFYEFIATKVLNSAKSLEKELKSKRAYEVYLSDVGSVGRSISIVRSLKGALTKLKKDDIQISYGVNCSKKTKNPCLIVRGNIGMECVRSALEKIAERYEMKYTINTKY